MCAHVVRVNGGKENVCVTCEQVSFLQHVKGINQCVCERDSDVCVCKLYLFIYLFIEGL